MDVDFDTKSDETGKGRIIVGGRYFGLPVEVVKLFEQLYKAQEEKRDEA